MLRQALSNNSGNKPPIFQVPDVPTTRRSDHGDDDVYSPLLWSDYFDLEMKVEIPGTSNVIQVYKAPEKAVEGPLFVLLHGCGLSALSWALVAKELKQHHNVLSFDFRGHGSSSPSSSPHSSSSSLDSPSSSSLDLSAETLVEDTVQLLNTLYASQTPPPAIVLVGHSMGGAIAARVAGTGRVKGVVGLAVVDVVEGTALAALGSMQNIIEKRPKEFSSPHKAVQWAVSSDTIRNIESARISIPSQLVQNDHGKWVWKTNLAATEPYWKGWFTNLSEVFLSSRAARLLLLAGTDRLDRPLTVGQMQGKFQLSVLPSTGHHVHEDAPSATASALSTFAARHQFGKPLVLPPKVTLPPKPAAT